MTILNVVCHSWRTWRISLNTYIYTQPSKNSFICKHFITKFLICMLGLRNLNFFDQNNKILLNLNKLQLIIIILVTIWNGYIYGQMGLPIKCCFEKIVKKYFLPTKLLYIVHYNDVECKWKLVLFYVRWRPLVLLKSIHLSRYSLQNLVKNMGWPNCPEVYD